MVRRSGWGLGVLFDSIPVAAAKKAAALSQAPDPRNEAGEGWRVAVLRGTITRRL